MVCLIVLIRGTLFALPVALVDDLKRSKFVLLGELVTEFSGEIPVIASPSRCNLPELHAAIDGCLPDSFVSHWFPSLSRL